MSVYNPYGWDHQVTRSRLLAEHVDGTPCSRCGLGMYRDAALNWDGRPLDAGHSRDVALNPGAQADRLEHAGCNRSAGATFGNRLRGHRVQADRPVRGKRAELPVTSRIW